VAKVGPDLTKAVPGDEATTSVVLGEELADELVEPGPLRVVTQSPGQ